MAAAKSATVGIGAARPQAGACWILDDEDDAGARSYEGRSLEAAEVAASAKSAITAAVAVRVGETDDGEDEEEADD